MKREEAKDLFRKDKDAYGKPRGIMGKIDLIYNDFDKEISEIQSMDNIVILINNLNYHQRQELLNKIR
jgi:hypothetical protein